MDSSTIGRIRCSNIDQSVDIGLHTFAADPIAFRRMIRLVFRQNVPRPSHDRLTGLIPGNPSQARLLNDPEILIRPLIANATGTVLFALEAVDEFIAEPAKLEFLVVFHAVFSAKAWVGM